MLSNNYIQINTVVEFLLNAKNSWPKKIALTHGKKSITFNHFFLKVTQRTNRLIEIGVKSGDRIAVCMDKSIDQAVNIFSIICSNAIFVPVLPKLKSNTIKHIIKDCEVKFIVTDDHRLNEVKTITNKSKIIIGTEFSDTNYLNLCDANKNLNNEINFNLLSNDLAAIIYSSGSTGMPKGIMIPHKSLYDGTRIVSSYLKTNHNEQIAGILSLNFDYGLNQLWQTFYKGCTLNLHEFLFVQDFFNFLKEKKITMLPLMPVMLTHILRGSSPKFTKIKKVKTVSSSGGALSKKILDGTKKIFPNSDIYSMYGLTEAFRSTFLDPKELKKRPDSIGKAIPDVNILVLNDKNEECPPNVPGELVHRGSCISKGYWNLKSKTKEKFKTIPQYKDEIVVFSGDVVTKDEEGFIYFVGRKDEMIKTHGFRVSPFEVEVVFNKFKKISSCVVFGLSDDDYGNLIILCYSSYNNVELSKNELFKYSKSNLPNHMIPKTFIFFKTMPSTGNQGKIDRVYVKNIALSMLKSH